MNQDKKDKIKKDAEKQLEKNMEGKKFTSLDFDDATKGKIRLTAEVATTSLGNFTHSAEYNEAMLEENDKEFNEFVGEHMSKHLNKKILKEALK